MTFLGNQLTSQTLPLKAIPNSSLGASLVAAGLYKSFSFSPCQNLRKNY